MSIYPPTRLTCSEFNQMMDDGPESNDEACIAWCLTIIPYLCMHHSEIVKMWLGSHPEIVQRPDHNLSHTIKAEFK